MRSMDSEAFYDEYVGRQLSVGVNERHHAILAWLQRFGMRPGQRVLEIGCGVGTLTGLIGRELGADGSLIGVDLSSKSIEAARARLGGLRNTEFLAGDILELEIEGTFDVVVLPDVIEHIPLELHRRLFERVAEWTAADGFVLLHYPNPYYLAWCHEHRPELLQHVDQPIYADELAAHVHASGLTLAFLETYSIWVREGDYVAAVLRHADAGATFTDVEPDQSLLQRLRGGARRILGR
jgi:trans-aconitate 2-methyltransferase